MKLLYKSPRNGNPATRDASWNGTQNNRMINSSPYPRRVQITDPRTGCVLRAHGETLRKWRRDSRNEASEVIRISGLIGIAIV